MDKCFNIAFNSIKLTAFLCCLLTFNLLTSCTTPVRKKDGPPNFYVDASRIPDAIPKKEAKSKYGNMKSYKVFGKRYYTLNSSKHFEETGIASWYGTLFHARKTSSGEPYDMLAMTAAHRTLPLPTYAEITNLSNQRKVVVKINDRGPFASNRVLDLSYVAARKLGMMGRGTALVRIRALDPVTQTWIPLAKKTPAKKQSPHAYLVQNYKNADGLIYLRVAAHKNKTEAQKIHQRLMTQLAHRVSISRPALTSRGYLIKVGPIHNVATAKMLRKKLTSMGMKPV